MSKQNKKILPIAVSHLLDKAFKNYKDNPGAVIVDTLKSAVYFLPVDTNKFLHALKGIKYFDCNFDPYSGVYVIE